MRNVRIAIAFTLVMVCLGAARAQEQEQKLLDRLLRPNLSLSNTAQGKRFAIERTASAKTVKQREFYTRAGPADREFTAKRGSLARVFGTRAFWRGKESANLSTRSTVRTKTFATQTSSIGQSAADGEKSVTTGQYAGTREFLGRGKSQKALSAHDTPLSIEQVRELLNRNK